MEIRANRVVQGKGKELSGLNYDFSCVLKASQEKHFPSKEFSQTDFCLVFWLFAFVPSLYSSSFYFPPSQALTYESRRWYKDTCICSKRQCAIRALEGGWPCGRSLPHHHFPPSVKLAAYDYRTLLNRVLEKSSCKLTKPGFVSKNGVSTQ